MNQLDIVFSPMKMENLSCMVIFLRHQGSSQDISLAWRFYQPEKKHSITFSLGIITIGASVFQLNFTTSKQQTAESAMIERAVVTTHLNGVIPKASATPSITNNEKV